MSGAEYQVSRIPPFSGIRVRTDISNGPHLESISSSNYGKCNPIYPNSVRFVSTFQGQVTLPPLAIPQSPVSGSLLDPRAPREACLSGCFLNTVHSAPCNSSPNLCTVSATTEPHRPLEAVLAPRHHPPQAVLFQVLHSRIHRGVRPPRRHELCLGFLLIRRL